MITAAPRKTPRPAGENAGLRDDWQSTVVERDEIARNVGKELLHDVSKIALAKNCLGARAYRLP